MKQIFKQGDRVYNDAFGWCTIDSVNINDNSLCFTSDTKFNGCTQHFFTYTYAVKIFSFTEYSLQGFSQERPINYEDYIGYWGRFWDNENDHKVEGVLEFIDTGDYSYFCKRIGYYDNFEPYPQEVLTALELTNENNVI